MEMLYEVLPLLIYILVAILLVVFIILGIKLIETVKKTNDLLDDLEKKSKSLDGMFEAVDNIADIISITGDRLLDGVVTIAGKLFNFAKKKKKKEEEYEEYE